jgi:tetratricopeptide (TPR) repeat protein
MPKFDAITQTTLRTAIRFMEEKKYPEAIQVLHMGLSKKLNNAYMLGLLGDVYSQMGDWQNALHYYKGAAEHDPEWLASHHDLLGSAHRMLGENNLAIIELNKGLAIVPNNNQLRLLLAYAYRDTGQPKEAFNEYKTILNTALGELVGVIHYLIAELYWKQSQFDDAIIELKKALTIIQNMGEPHYWLGKCYEKKGLLAEAKSENQIAINLGYNERKHKGEIWLD